MLSPDRNSVDVAIIGAGLAGLTAACDLTAAGLSVEVIEARERIGGRVLTARDASLTVPIELGAEFLHGSAPHTERIAREAGVTVCDVNGDRWEATARGLRPLDDFWEQLDRVMRRLSANRRRDRSFAEFLADRLAGRSLAHERRLATQWVRGFHAADPARASERALADGGSPGDDETEQRQARILEGYDRLATHLGGRLRREPRLGAVVTSIAWGPGEVELTMRRASGGSLTSTVAARAAVVTVPLGVLQVPSTREGAIAFEPSLPASKRQAFSCLAEGHVIRVAVVLDEPLWITKPPRSLARKRSLRRLAFIHPGDEDMPVCWTAYPTDAPVLVAWYGGPDAESLARLPQGEIEEQAVSALARRLHVAPRRFDRHVRTCLTHNWSADPFARGAYSYVLVGGIDAAATLARPVSDTLFFAGEAFDAEGRNGTVEGAIASGKRASEQVARVLGGRRAVVSRES